MLTPMTRDDADQLAAAVRVVADPVRLQILGLLDIAPSTGIDLQARLAQHGTEVKQPTVSHHLAILIRAGLVSSVQSSVFRIADLTDAGRHWATTIGTLR